MNKNALVGNQANFLRKLSIRRESLPPFYDREARRPKVAHAPPVIKIATLEDDNPAKSASAIKLAFPRRAKRKATVSREANTGRP